MYFEKDAERKRQARLKLKVLKSEVYEQKKKMERERLKQYRISPNKQTEVIGALATKYQLRINLCPQKPGPKAVELSHEENDWLEQFLDQGDMSYITPGRKDHKYVGKSNGSKQYIQKRYLRWNLRDL